MNMKFSGLEFVGILSIYTARDVKGYRWAYFKTYIKALGNTLNVE